MRKIGVLIAAVLLSSCAQTGNQNPYAQYFQDGRSQALPGSTRFVDFVGEPQLASASDDLKSDQARMYENGLAQMAASSFVGPSMSAQLALQQARTIHAAYVLVQSKYQSSDAMGNGRYEQKAFYYQPLERAGVGVMTDNLSTEMRQDVGTNKGVYIRAVRKESPAFKADLLPGDIILAVNGMSIEDFKDLGAKLNGLNGTQVELTIWHKRTTSQKKFLYPLGLW